MATTRTFLVVCVACVSMAAAGAARAEDWKAANRGRNEKEVASEIGKSAVNAAHPTGKYVRMISYDNRQTEARQTLTIKMEYYGALTGRRYVAEVEFVFVTAGQPTCVSIEYSDNNVIPEAPKWKEAMRRSINNALADNE